MAQQVTELLHSWYGGDAKAFDRLFPIVYNELKKIARGHMGRERESHTLCATSLVHEAYLKLGSIEELEWQDRRHFFAVAAKAMRRILISHARKRTAQKRGGHQRPVTLKESLLSSDADRQIDLLALDQAMNQLARFDARLAKTVELRFFGGLSIEETAEVLDVSPSTVSRDWRKARAWLHQELDDVRSNATTS